MIDSKYFAYLTEIGALALDERGEQVLVGLTAAETAEYFAGVDAALNGRQDEEMRKRCLELYAKHERARPPATPPKIGERRGQRRGAP